MYKKKMALVALLAAGLLGLAACNNTPSSSSTQASSTTTTTSSSPTSSVVVSSDVSIVKGWQDNGDEIYTPTLANDVLSVSYDKKGLTYPAMKLSMGAYATKLSGYKKLVMEIQLKDHTGAGPMSLLPKFEFNDNVAHPAHECKFLLSADKVTYEWDLSDQVLTDALQLLMFVDPTCPNTTGTLVFTKLYFSKDAVKSSGTTIVGVATVPTVNTYASGDTFNVMKNFYDGGDFAYTITQTDAKASMVYSKWGGNEYSYFGTIADNVSTFKYVNMKVKGPEGKTMLIKVENSNEGAVIKEQTLKFTGVEQDYTYYFKNNIGLTGKQKVNFFAEPGGKEVSTGTIEFTQLAFSNTALVAEPTEVVNAYTGMDPWSDNYAISNWKDGGDAKFTVTAASGVTTVAWSGQDLKQSWSNIQAPITGNLAHMQKISLNVTASGATKMLFKAEGTSFNVEQWATFAADTLTQDVVIDMSAKAVTDRETLNKVLVFPLSGDDGLQLAAGSLIINSCKFVNPILPTANSEGTAFENVNGLFGQKNYTITQSATGTKVDYTAAKDLYELIGFRLDPSVDYSKANAVKIHLSALTACTNILVKINDAQEYRFDNPAVDTDLELALSKAVDAAAKPFVLVFLDLGKTGTAGSVTFTSIGLAYDSTLAPAVNKYTGANAWDKSWGFGVWLNNGGPFTVSTNTQTGAVTAAWTNNSAQGWDNIKAPLDGDFSVFTKLTVNITTSAATRLLVKAEGTGNSGPAKEEWLVTTAEALTKDVTIDLSALSIAQRQLINNVYIFPLSDDTGLRLANGSIIINSASFNTPATPVAGTDSYEAVTTLFGPANYSFTRATGSTKVAYTAAKGEWEAIGFALDAAVDYSSYTKFIVHVSAVDGCEKLKFKFNDINTGEVNIDDLTTLTNDFTLTIPVVLNAASKSFVTCFVNYGITGKAGSVTFTKLALAK